MRFAPLAVLALVSCATSPAIRSPLREQLAVADTPRLEEATRTCLEQAGWKVDPIADYVQGSRRVSGVKNKTMTEVYINPPDFKPRITGGPDYDKDSYWSCLSTELGGAKAAPAPAPASS